jgi:hypothetical protein
MEQELRQLMRQRAEIAKRVRTIERIISGLSLLFGDELPSDLREFTREKSESRVHRRIDRIPAIRT